jgi:hypothetical protein
VSLPAPFGAKGCKSAFYTRVPDRIGENATDCGVVQGFSIFVSHSVQALYVPAQNHTDWIALCYTECSI